MILLKSENRRTFSNGNNDNQPQVLLVEDGEMVIPVFPRKRVGLSAS